VSNKKIPSVGYPEKNTWVWLINHVPVGLWLAGGGLLVATFFAGINFSQWEHVARFFSSLGRVESISPADLAVVKKGYDEKLKILEFDNAQLKEMLASKDSNIALLSKKVSNYKKKATKAKEDLATEQKKSTTVFDGSGVKENQYNLANGWKQFIGSWESAPEKVTITTKTQPTLFTKQKTLVRVTESTHVLSVFPNQTLTYHHRYGREVETRDRECPFEYNEGLFTLKCKNYNDTKYTRQFLITKIDGEKSIKFIHGVETVVLVAK